MDTQDNIGLNGDKKICHRLGCFNNATNSIREDGYDGTLMLCNDCIAKFPKQEPSTHELISEAPKL